MPASTIQVIGAEKALFSSLKTGAQPPKHGLLFQHAMVHAAPRWQRGKIARAIAAKAVIAARVDVYGEGLNKTLLEKLNVRVNEIGKKYEAPTEREPRESFRRDEDRDFRRKGGESRRDSGFRSGEIDSRRTGGYRSEGESRRSGGYRSEGESRKKSGDTKRAGKNYRDRADSKLNKNKKRKKFERR